MIKIQFVEKKDWDEEDFKNIDGFKTVAVYKSVPLTEEERKNMETEIAIGLDPYTKKTISYIKNKNL